MVRLAISFSAILLLAACSLGDDASRWRGSLETLPNGAVRVSNPAQGLWLENEAWHLVQELKLGSLEGAADLFASISDIEVDGDGRIYVLDRQLNELRIFDQAGSLLRSTGRSGLGPGEFDNAFGLVWLPGDSLLVADGRGRRYNIFDREGNFVRSMVRPLTSRKYMFDGGFTRGLLIESGLRRVGEGYQPALILMRLGAQAELVDTIAFPPGPSSPIQPDSAPEFSWYLRDDSTFWLGHGDEYRIVQLSLDGDTLREILAAADSLHKPYFTDLYVDPDGMLWVDVPTGDGLTAFDIFDEEGRLLGRIGTGVKRDFTIKPIVRDGKLYLVATDELDVPHVYVFRIERKDSG